MKIKFIAMFLLLHASCLWASEDGQENAVESAKTDIIIDLVADSKCMFGDLDVLLLNLTDSKGELALQLNLESLPLGSEEVYFGVPLKKEVGQKTNLGSFLVSLPSEAKSDVFFASLCTVSIEDSNKKRCSEQNLVSINESSLKFRVKSADKLNSSSYLIEESTSVPTPKIFYGQMLFLNSENVSKVTEGVISIDQLKNSLGSSKVTSIELEKIYADFKRFDNVIQSQPLRTNANRIELPLAFYDSKRCNGS